MVIDCGARSKKRARSLALTAWWAT